jgi:hypothetical protein
MMTCGKGTELEIGSLPETAPRLRQAALILYAHFDPRAVPSQSGGTCIIY